MTRPAILISIVGMSVLFLGAQARAMQSDIPGLTSYMDVRFQHATLNELVGQFGNSALFDTPGEVLEPDEVCYRTEDGLQATFFVEHYGRKRETNTVVGAAISRHHVDPSAKHPACAKPKVDLSNCIGTLCLGDSIDRVREILSKEMTDPGSDEWTYAVRLSPDDPVVRAYRDAQQGNVVPDWMYPSHIIRIKIANGVVAAIYVVIDVDMA